MGIILFASASLS